MNAMTLNTAYARPRAGLDSESISRLSRLAFTCGSPVLMALPFLGGGNDWGWFKFWCGQPLFHVLGAGLFSYFGMKGLGLSRGGRHKFLPFWGFLAAGMLLASMRGFSAALISLNGGAVVGWGPGAELAATVFFNGQIYWLGLPLLVWLAHLKERPLTRDLCALGGTVLLLLAVLKMGFPNFLQFVCSMAVDLVYFGLAHLGLL